MDILIKGMEMPQKDDIVIMTLDSNGMVNVFGRRLLSLLSPQAEVHGLRTSITTATALPEHGDLIERKSVLSYFETAFLMGADMDYEDIVGIVSNPKAIPTIVEATE